MGVAVTLLLLLAVLGVLGSPAVLLIGSAVAGWCFVLALLGIGRRFFSADGAVLTYLSESAFPVYVLHQSAIVLPGYVIVGLPLGIPAKFTLILLVSVAVTLAAYHWLVRPFSLPRFLLGMKPRTCALRRPLALSPSAAALVVVTVALATARLASAASPVGVWYAEGGAARVAVERCGDEICGHVVWLRSPLDEDGCDLLDRFNPDPTLRGRRVEGLEILRGLTPRPDGTWENGRIYDPATGRTYTCQLAVDGEDRLRLRGYVALPLLGRTTVWTRVGAENRLCRERRR